VKHIIFHFGCLMKEVVRTVMQILLLVFNIQIEKY